jgi:hypothetical protein
MNFLLKLATLGSAILLGLSVYPGVWVDLLLISILLFPLWLPALCIGGLVALYLRSRSAKKAVEPDPLADDEIGGGKTPMPRRRPILFPSSVLILCVVLILTGIPRRVAFLLSRPAFQRHVATAPASEYEGEALGRFVGVYYVDRYAADPRGGVYFRTHAGADGIGPDTMSYGFAYRPNPQGTPFGRAGYNCSRIVGDWYAFSASDDW